MTKYSFNRDTEGIIFASLKDVNASFKDLSAVCAAIRYKSYLEAVDILDGAAAGTRAIEFKRHNKGMGHRHELGGRKGRWPVKCSELVRKVVVNAAANARNKDYEPDLMYVVHASANKTQTWGRMPPKGPRSVPGNHTMGFQSSRMSNLEHARIEIGLAKGTESGLSENMRSAIKRSQRYVDKVSKSAKPKLAQPKKKDAAKPEKKAEAQKQPAKASANDKAKEEKPQANTARQVAEAKNAEDASKNGV